MLHRNGDPPIRAALIPKVPQRELAIADESAAARQNIPVPGRDDRVEGRTAPDTIARTRAGARLGLSSNAPAQRATVFVRRDKARPVSRKFAQDRHRKAGVR